MYVMIRGNAEDDDGVIYIELPENPPLSVYYDADFGSYIAATHIDGGMMVLKTGERHECHELVNKILKQLKLKPIIIQ